MDRRHVLDLYFIDARARLIDIAAFLDRLDRASPPGDFRQAAFLRAIKELDLPTPDRARRVLLALSDPTLDPIPASPGKTACGAHDSHESLPPS